MEELAELFGESPTIGAFRDKLRGFLTRLRAGQRLPAVLLQGDTGTGKGLVARLLHHHGPRRLAPFIDVNCAAIPETLLEAELFGFERGAFTHARHAKPGLLQAAHGGVLFLDEVALLPEPLQAKLLTAVEERAVRRLGSTRPEPADAWLISATNTDLPAAVRARRFREDLYHRLAVLALSLPPLRERGQDILLLAERFLARACAEYGLPSKRLDPAAQARLLAYAWPGNIRELSNVMERAALFAEGPVLTADSLGPLEAEAPSAPGSGPLQGTATSRDEAMRQRLLMALEQTGWNISHTADRLGITRHTVYARLEKFGLRQAPPRKAVPDSPRSVEPATGSSALDTRLHWERRSLTLLRAELAKMDGGDTRSQTSRALDAIIAKVDGFGGRLQEITPTGLVAAFGLEPVEDAPRRAALTAMAIRKEAERARARDGAGPDVAIALHVASLLIGQVGTRIEIDAGAKRGEWPVLDRLLRASGPGETVVSGAAVPFLERRFELVRIGDSQEDGSRLTGQERQGLGLWGAMTPFVGRRKELELLQSRLDMAGRGQGQVVSIVGEAGVGKSRLLHELTSGPRPEGWRVLEAAAFSYSQSMSYLPLVGLLRNYFKIRDRDEQPDIREKVAGKLLTLDRSLEPALPPLLTLLDVPVEDRWWQRLDPSQRRRRTIDAVNRVFLAEAQAQPLLVIFEDLHWIDSETQALLDGLVDSLPAARLLLLVNHRPEYRHGWGGKTYYTQLRLDALPAETAADLLRSLVGGDETLAPLERRLAERTSGNPLFLEESVRALAETGVLVGERGAYRPARSLDAIEVPATVQAILAARIDCLASEDKAVLQAAAVIGKDVPFALLHAIAEEPELALREALGRLQAAEYLYETTLSPDLKFTFKHALTHEVAYGGLLQERRKALHAHVVVALQRLYPDRLTEHFEQLANHAFKGELWAVAARYLRQAGTKAADRYALREAVAWFDQALNVLPHLQGDTATPGHALDIRLGRQTVLTILGDYRVVRENLSEAERLAEQLGDERRLGQVYRAKANLHNHAGQMDEALVCGDRALKVAERFSDLPLRRDTTTMLVQSHYMRGEFERVIDLARANLSALPADGVRARAGGPVPTSVYDRGFLVRGLTELGRFAEAAEHAEAALQIAERTQHPYAIGWACMCAGNLHSWKGEWDSAHSLYERAIAVFRDADVVITLSNVTAVSSWPLACLGDPGALTRAREGERLLGVSREQRRISNSFSYIWLCHAYLRLGRVEDVERVLPLVLEPPAPWSEAFTWHLRGEIAARPEREQPAAADEHHRRSLALAQGLGMRPLVARCHHGLGTLYRRTGKRQPAEEHLTIARTMYREMDMTYWLEQIAEDLI